MWLTGKNQPIHLHDVLTWNYVLRSLSIPKAGERKGQIMCRQINLPECTFSFNTFSSVLAHITDFPWLKTILTQPISLWVCANSLTSSSVSWSKYLLFLAWLFCQSCDDVYRCLTLPLPMLLLVLYWVFLDEQVFTGLYILLRCLVKTVRSLGALRQQNEVLCVTSDILLISYTSRLSDVQFVHLSRFSRGTTNSFSLLYRCLFVISLSVTQSG